MKRVIFKNLKNVADLIICFQDDSSSQFVSKNVYSKVGVNLGSAFLENGPRWFKMVKPKDIQITDLSTSRRTRTEADYNVISVFYFFSSNINNIFYQR